MSLSVTSLFCGLCHCINTKTDAFLHVTHDYVFFLQESGGARHHRKTKRDTVVLVKPISLLTSHMVLTFTHNLDLVSVV